MTLEKQHKIPKYSISFKGFSMEILKKLGPGLILNLNSNLTFSMKRKAT